MIRKHIFYFIYLCYSPIYFIYKNICKYVVYKFSKKEFIYDSKYYSTKYIPNKRLPKGILDDDLQRYVVGIDCKTKMYIVINQSLVQERDI